jgi:hypothetical protein
MTPTELCQAYSDGVLPRKVLVKKLIKHPRATTLTNVFDAALDDLIDFTIYNEVSIARRKAGVDKPGKAL